MRSIALVTNVASVFPRSKPAAVTAIGSSDVSVMPGATLASRTCGRPSASTIRSTRDRSPRPSAACVASATSATRAATSDGSRAGACHVVTPGGVPGRVVVHAVARHDLDGRQARPVRRRGRRTDDRDVHAGHVRLDQRGRVVGEAAHHRGRQVRRPRVPPRRPDRNHPAPASPSTAVRAGRRSGRAPRRAPNSENRSCGSATQSAASGSRRLAQHSLGRRLVPGEPRTCARSQPT